MSDVGGSIEQKEEHDTTTHIVLKCCGYRIFHNAVSGIRSFGWDLFYNNNVCPNCGKSNKIKGAPIST